ncbi:MAG: amidohydrolase [Brucellaceae bacterium]|nr:amidohydrolase [Brucellaceae bacterium]
MDTAALVAFRRQLHMRPELSGEEEQTAADIVARMEAHRPDQLLHGLGGHGVAAVFESGQPGPSVLFRCELDGLPIAETGRQDWRSRTPGKAHLCGHDGHMAILLGLAGRIAGHRPAKGRVILLFQPAEETGAGARAVLADPRFKSVQPDYAFALHNLPGMPLGHAALRDGPMNFASEGLAIRLAGRTSHASQPENGVSPAAAMTELVDALPNLPATLGIEAGKALATLVHARLGEEAFGISPGEALVMATLRAIDDATQARLMDAAETMAEDAAKRHGLGLSLARSDRFAACANDADAAAAVRAACGALDVPVSESPEPFRWSEDFGLFGSVSKSALFVLGAGEDCPPLHAPDYDFPDALIETGVSLFERIARNLCG